MKRHNPVRVVNGVRVWVPGAMGTGDPGIDGPVPRDPRTPVPLFAQYVPLAMNVRTSA